MQPVLGHPHFPCLRPNPTRFRVRGVTPPRPTPAIAGSTPRRSRPRATPHRCARRCPADAAAGLSWLPSTQIGLLMVSMVSPSNGTSTSFSSICLSSGMSSRMPTTPNTRPLPSSILRHSARSLVANISSKILISSSDRAWRSALVAKRGSVTKSSRPDAARQRRPLPFLVEQRQDDPASVPALVVIGHRVQRALARPPLAEFGAAEFGLGQHRRWPRCRWPSGWKLTCEPLPVRSRL